MFLNLFVLFFHLDVIVGNKVSPLYKLHQTVTEGYKPHIRPIKNSRRATNVTVDFSMFSVEDFHEASENFISFGTFNITWYDEWLVWNTSDHDGIQEIKLPLHHVWTPDLVVSNSVEEYHLLSDTKGIVSVLNTGFITWYRTMRQITKCSMDMSKFPLDSQTCSVRLIQWMSNNNEVCLLEGSVTSNYSPFKSHGEWKETAKSITTKTYNFGETLSQNEISFTFSFQRRPLHFVITSVLPVLLLSVLNLGVFLLPPESGEKISLCISVFLSYAVILTDINGDLPHTPDSIGIFKVYLLSMLLIKVLTILATVAILKRYHTKNGTRMNKEEREMTRLRLDENDGRWYERILSAEVLNKLSFAVISLIMIATTSVCLAVLLF